MAVMDFGVFQTANRDFQKILVQAGGIATGDQPILICGEVGTGRRLMAQFLQEKGNSRHSLVRYQKQSPFRPRGGEWILIEELQFFSAAEQEFLIQQMQSLGPQVRWIATAAADFFQIVEKGLIRRQFVDLFPHVLNMPSLKSRPEDFPLLVEQILLTLSWVTGRLLRLSKEAMAVLQELSWPENVSDLEKMLEAAALRTSGPIIEVQHLQVPDQSLAAKTQITTLAEMEKKLIIQTLQITQNNRSQAARLLGISIRTLRNKLSQYREEGIYESTL